MSEDRCLKAIARLKAFEQSDTRSELQISTDDPNAPLMTSLGNGLGEMYVVDEGDHYAYLQNRDLAGALTIEDVHARALENLEALTVGQLMIHTDGEIHPLTMGGDFEASLILLDKLWDETLAHHAPNGFVVAAPARDLLAFTDSQSGNGTAHLRRFVRGVVQRGHLEISPFLYRREGRRWLPMA